METVKRSVAAGIHREEGEKGSTEGLGVGNLFCMML